MGGKTSTLDKTKTPPFLREPWRKINWADRHGALKVINDYKPLVEGQQLRVLVYGPEGAGKSSFINTVNSVLRGKMYNQALVDAIGGFSFTKKYKTYKIQKGGPGSFYPFVFNDISGLSPDSRVLVDDVKLALKGHVKDGCMFNPQYRLNEDSEYYNKSPTANDKVHLLVCVVPADTAEAAGDVVCQKIREIRAEASYLDIPQLAVLTKIDQMCPEIKDDLKNVYKSTFLKEKMKEFSAEVGIPMNCIFPVRNYFEETELNNDIDALILDVMKNIVRCGEDYVNFQNAQN